MLAVIPFLCVLPFVHIVQLIVLFVLVSWPPVPNPLVGILDCCAWGVHVLLYDQDPGERMELPS